MALAAVDRGGEWGIDGSASMAAWVRNHLFLTHSTAARVLRTGRRLLDLPATTAAWLSGSLSDGQIEILVANVTDRRAALWAQHEADLVPGLAALDLESTKVALRTWAARADAILDEDEPPAPPAAEATLVQTLDGQGYLKGSFDAEGHDLIATALRLADVEDRELTAAARATTSDTGKTADAPIFRTSLVAKHPPESRLTCDKRRGGGRCPGF